MTETGSTLATKTVRVATIGAGKMANRVHYPSLASFPDVELAAICDLDTERLATTAETYGIAARFTDYWEMVERVSPDAVYAIGPPHQMYDVWVWRLRQGAHLFERYFVRGIATTGLK